MGPISPSQDGQLRERHDTADLIPRRLWQAQSDGNHKVVEQHELPSWTGPLVILGEAGAGKTCLLTWLADAAGYVFCTARKLTTTPDPARLLNPTHTLVIDALDELNTRRDGDSVDAVLRKLAAANYPRFILSCRVADWRSATSVQAIEEHYGTRATELHLRRLDADEAREFLRMRCGAAESARILQHLTARGLDALLGNPQTLHMVAEVVRTQSLPETKTELLQTAVEILSQEHQDGKAEHQYPQADMLDAAGAACAALILSDHEAITRRAVTPGDASLRIVELNRLTKRDVLNAVLDTRLFVAADADRFTYLHRSIAEFLGARWLARQCTSARQRRRLLRCVQADGGVPAALRGIHAWLAVDHQMREQVIEADPMGFVEYGDPGLLSPSHAQLLLAALRRLAQHNPAFLKWKELRVPALLHPNFQAEVGELIATKDTPHDLRILLLQTLRDARPESPLAPEMRRIALDPMEWFSARSAAGKAWVAIFPDEDWPKEIESLCDLGDESSIRLALQVMKQVSYQHFTDLLIVSVARAYAEGDHQIHGLLYMLQRDLPTERIDGVLDHLSQQLGCFDDVDDSQDEATVTLTDFAYHLIDRRLKAHQTIEAITLWRWLRPYKASRGYQQDTRTAVNEFLRQNAEIRQAIQKVAILEERASQGPWHVAWAIRECVAGLVVTEPDVVALLGALYVTEPLDERWKDILQLTPHDDVAGAMAREAARRLVGQHPEHLAWIDALAHPVKPQWQIDQEKRAEQGRLERQQRLTQIRTRYLDRIDEMKAGAIDLLIVPAQAYLGFLHEFQNPDPIDRVKEMLGDELADAALQGFEAAILQPARFPYAKEMADALARGRILNASMVLAAGLAERIRRSNSLDDLSDDCILKSFVATYQTTLTHSVAADEVQKAIADCALVRNLWKQGIRLREEPQFVIPEARAYDLAGAMRDEAYSKQSTEMALDWLHSYPQLPLTAEFEIVDRLIASQELEALRLVWRDRSQSPEADRRRLWHAVGLMVDFDLAAKLLASMPIEPELLWDLRARITNERKGSKSSILTVAQTSWIISTFRSLWPRASHPSRVWTGDTNAWDATDFIDRTIESLGSDLSTEACRALSQLHDAPKDDYTLRIKLVIAEQRQAMIEANFDPLSLDAIQAIVADQTPASIEDLQAFMLDELDVVQTKIKGDDAESWRGFFNDEGVPHHEERCRDHLIGLLRQGCQAVALRPEAHVASDKEVDITCEVQGLRLPIEIKGQWHRDLWTAADLQLDRLYASDWQAQDHGIYLVLWFGASVQENKRLARPGGQNLPTNANQLRDMLHATSKAAQQGRIAIVVLDIERPSR